MECGVSKLVYTSSATVLIPRGVREFKEGREEMPYPQQHLDDYTQHKHEAELLVRAAHLSSNPSLPGHSLHTCIIRPTGIYGVGDKRLVDSFLKDKDNFAVAPGTALIDLVYVDSVARGHLLAAAAMPGVASGQIYHIGNGKPCQYRWFIGYGTGDGKTSHWRGPPVSLIPCNLVLLLAFVNEMWAKLFFAPLLSPSLAMETITFTQTSWSFSIDKARRELGYEPFLGGDVPRTIEHIVNTFRPLNDNSGKKKL